MLLHPKSWNHNSRYHRTLLRAVPHGAQRALDIGCGDGTFAAKLAQRCQAVVALDVDDGQVAATQRTCTEFPNVTVLNDDFLTAQFDDASLDVVTALATVHHMPLVQS